MKTILLFLVLAGCGDAIAPCQPPASMPVCEPGCLRCVRDDVCDGLTTCVRNGVCEVCDPR